MPNHLKILFPKNHAGILGAVLMALFLQCATPLAENPKQAGPDKRITDILVAKSSDSLTFLIKANESLTYTAHKLDFPMGVMLYFPDTGLALDRSVYSPPDNEMISSVKAREMDEDKTTAAGIFFALKRDSSYALDTDDDGIRITFAATAVLSNRSNPPQTAVKKKSPGKTLQKSPPAARRLKAVTAKPHKNHITIEVTADGAVQNYKSFSLDQPDRIVLDLFDLTSPHQTEQIIAVESQWVKQIRHFGHPDRLRLVIETHPNYLSRYAALATDTGLLIHVGEIPVTSNQSGQIQ